MLETVVAGVCVLRGGGIVCVCVGGVCLRERDGTWGSKDFKLEGYSIYKRETPHFKNSWWKIGRCSVPTQCFLSVLKLP